MYLVLAMCATQDAKKENSLNVHAYPVLFESNDQLLSLALDAARSDRLLGYSDKYPYVHMKIFHVAHNHLHSFQEWQGLTKLGQGVIFTRAISPGKPPEEIWHNLVAKKLAGE